MAFPPTGEKISQFWHNIPPHPHSPATKLLTPKSFVDPGKGKGPIGLTKGKVGDLGRGTIPGKSGVG